MLESTVLLVVLGLQHLILQLRDLLLRRKDVQFLLPAFPLVGGESRLLGVEFFGVRFELLLDFGNLFWQLSDFPLQFQNPHVEVLKFRNLLKG